ncbi:hypothetical protein GCK32_022747 [Trichostrongylus colubriformis]|uniref:Uncharacterized protein n=1 Tax=Trichostrongylus colubriformis TaxID=6319 RepID=A0AAN8FB38_TRICO
MIKSISAPMPSTVLGFMRGLDPTVVRIDSGGRWLLDHTTADILQFIVTRECFELRSVCGDLLPVDDYILLLVTASKFAIEAPNLITLDGLKAFVEVSIVEHI